MMLDIRFIHNSELPKLYALRQEVLRKPLGLNLYDKDFSEEQNWIKIGGFIEQNLVACIMISTINNCTMQLRQMAVDASYQGMGYGSKLLHFAENFCIENKCDCIELHARNNAIVFYEKHGFTVIGDGYIEVGIPHFSMIKMLASQ